MSDKKQVAENLPIIFNEGNEIVFNKAAVRFEGVEPQKIEQDIKTAQDFLASDPDLSDKIQYKQLVALQSLLRGHRTGLDKKRKGLGQIFRDATAYINGKAKEIIGPAQEVENQLKELRNAYEAEQERIAQEKARKEEERVNKIESRICFIRNLPSECIGKSVITIDNYICDLLRTDEDFQEFQETGNLAKEKAIEQLKKLLESAIAEEERAEKERIAEEERKRREAEERAEFERQQKDLAVQQEAAQITASVANFVNASSREIRDEIERLKKYAHPAVEPALYTASMTAVNILESMIPAAEQREAVARQAEEQEAERQRIEIEKKAEEQRKAEEESRKKAEKERAEREAQEAAEQRRLAEEAECRKTEDFGQTVAALSDLLDKICELEQSVDIAEIVAEEIQDGEIPFVVWSNER